MRGSTVLLLLVLGFIGQKSSCIDIFPGKKHFVRIVNQLEKEQLDYHCRSADDDLGLRSLLPNGEWEFGFRNDFLKTHWDCDFWYANYSAHFRAFDLDDDFLEKCGGAHCIWAAREDGISLFSITENEWYIELGWTENKPHF
ncbi:PREDICTED: S-homolog [Prunus dulcis]|uniref:S-protein homolog n=1 Tax=Prunus dulcis TaxID=3755 RepID=A0A5E4G5S2_PRUDU|nr:hypothetical protein L3X38_001217 [Prunus dulcis]VVA35127.1 PREDICTED: S-homolog [Prunus dulcis]